VLNLIFAVFSSPKLICFEGKMNHTLIKVISSIFYYFFPSFRQGNPTTIERGVFQGNPFIHPFLDFFVTGEECVRKCVLHQPEEMVIRRSGEYAGCGRISHSSCRSVCFTLFATCGRALSCKRMTMRRLLTTDDLFCINSSLNWHNCC